MIMINPLLRVVIPPSFPIRDPPFNIVHRLSFSMLLRVMLPGLNLTISYPEFRIHSLGGRRSVIRSILSSVYSLMPLLE